MFTSLHFRLGPRSSLSSAQKKEEERRLGRQPPVLSKGDIRGVVCYKGGRRDTPSRTTRPRAVAWAGGRAVGRSVGRSRARVCDSSYQPAFDSAEANPRDTQTLRDFLMDVVWGFARRFAFASRAATCNLACKLSHASGRRPVVGQLVALNKSQPWSQRQKSITRARDSVVRSCLVKTRRREGTHASPSRTSQGHFEVPGRGAVPLRPRGSARRRHAAT